MSSANKVKKRLLEAAIAYLNKGFSIVVVGKDKAPIHPWKEYQSRPIIPTTLSQLLDRSEAHGIGILGGAISGNFITFDIDTKNDPSGQLYNNLILTIQQQSTDIVPNLPIASTPSGGVHFYYYTQHEWPSMVLAKRNSNSSQTSNKPPDSEVLIELRAKGEYTIVPPTPGYAFQQRSLDSLPILDDKDHHILINAAKSIDQSKLPQLTKPLYRKKEINLASPLDDFDMRGNVIELLLRHGWTIYPQHLDTERIYLKRPGNTRHRYSANYHIAFNIFIVHSTSTVFLPKQPYKPAAVYSLLECNGDFSLAAKRLLNQGYGIPYHIQRRIRIT